MKINELIVATHNEHKLEEIGSILPGSIILTSLVDLGFYEEIEESGFTFEENAFIKSQAIFKRFNKNVFSDDSGLEVSALNMAPGVYSARYAGPDKDDKKNVDKLLKSLKNNSNRSARFRTVICLILGGEIYYFEGVVNGYISQGKQGNNGFGYDPVFIPDGWDKTFAEMSNEEKNSISHRSLALTKMKDFLK